MRWILLIVLARVVLANDGSGESTPAGGVQLRREARISMEKERLTIGLDKVTVEYEFLNDTSTDITTEVLFPIPHYRVDVLFQARGLRPVGNFRVWVDGREVSYQSQVEALVKGVDRMSVLREFGIDALAFGHLGEDGVKSDIERLSAAQQATLVRTGLVGDGVPLWELAVTYHWQQTFPAHRVVRIRHEYAPATGMDHWDGQNVRGKKQGVQTVPSDFCMDAPLRRVLEKAVPKDNGFAEGYVDPTWVDYILTTANTWKTPIKDFELIIERPKPKGGEFWYVSLCWPGKLQTKDANTFVARERNFVPKQELRVMFVQVGR